MVSNVVTLRIDDKTANLVDKLIKYKLAKNKADALRWIMQNGMSNTKKAVEQREKSQAIIRNWKKNRFPVLPRSLSELSIKEREHSELS